MTGCWRGTNRGGPTRTGRANECYGDFSLVSYQRSRQEPTNSLTYQQLSRPNDHELASARGGPVEELPARRGDNVGGPSHRRLRLSEIRASGSASRSAAVEIRGLPDVVGCACVRETTCARHCQSGAANRRKSDWRRETVSGRMCWLPRHAGQTRSFSSLVV